MSEEPFISSKQIDGIRRIYSKVEGLKLESFLKRPRKNQLEVYRSTIFRYEDTQLQELDLDELENKKIFFVASEKDCTFILTLKGMVMCRYNLFNPSNATNTFLNDLNKEFFENLFGFSEEALDCKEKSVILTLLGLGAISKEYALKVSEENQTHIREAVNRSFSFLESLGQTYRDRSVLWNRKVEGEGPVLAEMRRLNKIQPRTEGIYSTIKNEGKHYLKLYQNGEFEEKKFLYLLKRIFNKRSLTFDEKHGLLEVLKAIQVFEFKLFQESPEFDLFEIRKRIEHIIESEL